MASHVAGMRLPLSEKSQFSWADNDYSDAVVQIPIKYNTDGSTHLIMKKVIFSAVSIHCMQA